MDFTNTKVAVTGGAGFIGSHVIDELLTRNATVICIDNMRSGQSKIVESHAKNKNYSLEKIDLFLEPEKLNRVLNDIDFVFHFAANADIRGGMTNTKVDLEENTIATYNVLEAMRKNDVKKICFTSSAAIYGEQKIIPTPETAPKTQNSLYGASKLAGESLIEAFSFYYDMHNYMYRFVSIVGERYPHGVVIDFFNKLRKNPKKLEILGNGKQQKSFLYIKDCIAGVFTGVEKAKEQTNIFNLGHDTTVSVDQVADWVIDELKLKNVERSYTGGVAGWKGDQPKVLLATDRIKSLGWKPKTSIEEGIRKTVRYLVENES